jgi:hypothetical protein
MSEVPTTYFGPFNLVLGCYLVTCFLYLGISTYKLQITYFITDSEDIRKFSFKGFSFELGFFAI